MEMTRGHIQVDGEYAVAEAIHPRCAPRHRLALVLASGAIVLSALHFWPFEHSRIWQMVLLPNLAAALWVVLAVGYMLWQRRPEVMTDSMPHVSVLAFLVICLLSSAFARDPGRAFVYSAKSCLAFVGGYILVHSATTNWESMRVLYGTATVALAIAVSSCLMTRYVFGLDRFGFHGSEYKYGTYVGVLAPLCSGYLLEYGGGRRMAGALVLLAASVSCATMGAAAGITAGTAVFLLVARSRSAKTLAVTVLTVGGVLALVLPPPGSRVLRADLTVREGNGLNVRQRYAEWQAELNLLAERTALGTGAGSINDYRSKYYYRLPKLNTLAAFDQNGWLACGAETGILGLACFGWVICVHVRKALCSLRGAATLSDGRHAVVTANLAGLAAACLANLFSSVHYNGILIVFVLVLALISRTYVLGGAFHASG
jgi:hypothetical protein